MKKKRIILHICILLLAAACMVAGMYICYWEEHSYREDKAERYNEDYSYDVASILNYGYAQAEFRTQYADENKVLIENEELGNITVKDIRDLFSEHYYDYYIHDSYVMNYEDYKEYYEGVYDEAYLGTPNTVYENFFYQMQKYKKEYGDNPTSSNKERYQYYEDICKAVDAYADLVQILTEGIINDGNNIEKYDDYAFLVNDTYPEVYSGMIYFVQYTLNGEQYTISNVINEEIFNLDDSLVDLTILKDGVLTQDDSLYGSKNFETDIHEGSKQTVFLGQADQIYVAVYTGDTSSHYCQYIQKIKEQPAEVQRQEIKKYERICIAIIAVTLVIALILYIILMLMAGHREKDDEPQLYRTDRLWWDLEFVLMVIISFCIAAVFIELAEAGYYELCAIITFVTALPTIEFIVLISESLMRRLKTKSFLKTTLCGKLWKIVKVLAKKLNQGFHNLLGNISLTWKVIVLGAVVFIWQIIIAYVEWNYDVLGVVILAAIAVLVMCYLIWRYFNENKIVEEGAKKIADGDLDFKIDGDMKFGRNQSLKESINNIGEGLNAAVEESVKNERMKTELITNVSHDLKTPLTSIINYVDLLKTDGLEGKDAKKYLDILDQKSQRLKQLTEDLVEVSKLSSGAVTLEREKLDIVQLIRQSLGEYDEKFKRRNLQIVKSVQKEPLYVMADGRKTWRLFENLYENVYKYAMAGTRVYVDVKTESGKVNVSVKNISENPLNFSADELMERFVRGDASRTTEGSGLGLSIARSIVERQDGEMKIVLDGDLFKVEIVMNLI